MIGVNSGKIYCFPLDSKQGYACCELVDFSDINFFSGRLLTVYSMIYQSIEEIPNLQELDRKDRLFGPVPLTRNPNTRGPKSWKYLGQLTPVYNRIPRMKIIRGSYMAKDWSATGPWFEVYELQTESREAKNYEEVRTLELPVLHSIEEIQTRTTIHYLLKKDAIVSSYYDLDNPPIKHIFIRIVNTSFEYSVANQLLQNITPF